MEVKGRVEREGLVAAVTDKPVELTDTATKVCLTPNLEEETTGGKILTPKKLTV